MSRQTNQSRRLFIGAVIALLIWVAAIILVNHHYTYDPYGWLDPEHEGGYQHGLWLLLRDIYVVVGIVSFATAIAFGSTGFALRRGQKTLDSNAI